MLLLQRILDDAAAISPDQFWSPEQAVQEGETVLGELSDELKALFTLLHHSTDEIRTIHGELEAAFKAKLLSGNLDDLDPDKIKAELGEKFQLRHREAHARNAIIDKAFWYGVREQYPDNEKFNTVAIRAAGQVVAFNAPEEEDGCSPLDIFGGGAHGIMIVSSMPFGLGRRPRG